MSRRSGKKERRVLELATVQAQRLCSGGPLRGLGTYAAQSGKNCYKWYVPDPDGHTGGSPVPFRIVHWSSVKRGDVVQRVHDAGERRFYVVRGVRKLSSYMQYSTRFGRLDSHTELICRGCEQVTAEGFASVHHFILRKNALVYLYENVGMARRLMLLDGL